MFCATVPLARVGILVGAWTVMGWMGAPGDVMADPVARITVTVIHAKRSPPFLHEQVKPLWDTLRKTFGDRFASYDLLTSTEREVVKGSRMVVPIPDGGTFAVVYRGQSDDRRFLKLTIEHRDLKSRLRIHDGGLFFQAGARYKGGILIVGVRASTVTNQ